MKVTAVLLLHRPIEPLPEMTLLPASSRIADCADKPELRCYIPLRLRTRARSAPTVVAQEQPSGALPATGAFVGPP